MKKLYLVFLFVSLFISSCDRQFDVNYPVVDGEGFLTDMHPVTDRAKLAMEGIYKVVEGNEVFGDQVVLKWTGSNLSLFTYQSSGYAVLKGGTLESYLFFSGFWRHAINSEVGSLSFRISSVEGGSQILIGDTTDLSITIRGSYDKDDASLSNFQLEYIRPFSPAVKNKIFHILAHRGGGRNSDYLQASENTIEMISLAEGLGATGVELDVQLTKDGIPILYHDPDINLRLTQKSLIWGDIENYTYAQLTAFVTLKNGEKIPKLEDALNYIVDRTNLKFVWLDLKSDYNEIPAVIKLQREILKKINDKKRELQVVVGLPASDKYNFMVQEDYRNIPTLCELDINRTLDIYSKVWAPRWTEGIQTANVNTFHASGADKLAFVWTLDEPEFIRSFLNEGDFDGILTNYPTLVAYYHYIKE